MSDKTAMMTYRDECEALREQVEKLKAELKSIDGALNDPRANLTLTTSEIIWELKGQVEKLTKERDAAWSVNPTVSENLLREQLAALAEQNEKLKDALKTVVDDAEECTDHDDWTAMLLSLEAYHIASTCLEEIDELPNLTTPVLNRIRAEGVRKASTLVSLVRNDWASAGDTLSVQAAEYLISALDARAAELENETCCGKT